MIKWSLLSFKIVLFWIVRLLLSIKNNHLSLSLSQLEDLLTAPINVYHVFLGLQSAFAG